MAAMIFSDEVARWYSWKRTKYYVHKTVISAVAIIPYGALVAEPRRLFKYAERI